MIPAVDSRTAVSQAPVHDGGCRRIGNDAASSDNERQEPAFEGSRIRLLLADSPCSRMSLLRAVTLAAVVVSHDETPRDRRRCMRRARFRALAKTCSGAGSQAGGSVDLPASVSAFPLAGKSTESPAIALRDAQSEVIA
jgi:hypothetical protein